jgi:hypothetical protein
MPSIKIPAFIEKEFPNEINFGFSGGPVFFTQVSATTGGYEQRQLNWEFARHRYQAAHELKNRAELETLLDFFFSVRGMAVGFRFVDWNDWSSDVVANQGLVYPALAAAADMTSHAMLNIGSGAIGVGDGAQVDFQTQKLYTTEPVVGDFMGVDSITFTNSTGKIVRTVGSWITDGFVVGDYVYVSGTLSNLNDGTLGKITARDATEMTVDGTLVDELTPRLNIRIFSQAEDVPLYIREIKKLVTIRVTVDGTIWTEAPSGADTYTVDLNTGIVTANTAPAAGELVEADFVYNVPVRFEKDDWTQTLQHFNVGDVADIELIEIRVA